VWPVVLVVLSAVPDEDLRRGQAAKQINDEQLVADARAEGLEVGVLPRRSGLDIGASRR
jgi:hypothetical protein